MKQMWTCRECNGMRFQPGIAVGYAGPLCHCSTNSFNLYQRPVESEIRVKELEAILIKACKVLDMTLPACITYESQKPEPGAKWGISDCIEIVLKEVRQALSEQGEKK